MIGSKKVHIRVVGAHIMVRTGGGWEALRQWLAATFGKNSTVDIDDVFAPKNKRSQEKRSVLEVWLFGC